LIDWLIIVIIVISKITCLWSFCLEDDSILISWKSHCNVFDFQKPGYHTLENVPVKPAPRIMIRNYCALDYVVIYCKINSHRSVATCCRILPCYAKDVILHVVMFDRRNSSWFNKWISNRANRYFFTHYGLFLCYCLTFDF